MAKNLDGIKKLNPEEIKKNRKIVLSYIGEKASELTEEPKTASRMASVFNKVDGIRSNGIHSLKLKVNKVNNMPEQPAPAQEKIKQEVKLAKIKAAAKRKIKRQKAIKLFKKNLNNKLGEFFLIVKQNFVYGMLYLIVFLIIGYAVFCLLVLRFKIDNNIIRKMARILPVPAAVTNQGIINYYDWRDLKNNNYANLNLAEKKNSLAKWIILKNLSGKYGLPLNPSNKALAIALAADEDFNQAGLARIKKISQLLKNVAGLEQLSKYADEFNEVVYYNSENAAEKFGPAVFNLNVNQISDIIFSDNGYYIAQIIDNKNGQLGLKYLFVGAKTLDQYLSEKLAKIKIFILAN